MLNFKIIAGFAIFAFLISLLAGLFGVVPFGTLMVRTLFGTIFFAGLGLGVSWLIGKFIPDLLGGPGNDRKEESDAMGAAVDIVLPEENPHAQAGSDQEILGENATMEVDSLDDVESLEGAQNEAQEAGAANSGGSDATDDKDANTAVTPDKAAQDPGASGGREGDISSENDMPALDSLEGNFSEAGVDRGDTSDSAGGGNVTIMGQEQDAATAAKAIQTWLKKDEEG